MSSRRTRRTPPRGSTTSPLTRCLPAALQLTSASSYSPNHLSSLPLPPSLLCRSPHLSCTPPPPSGPLSHLYALHLPSSAQMRPLLPPPPSPCSPLRPLHLPSLISASPSSTPYLCSTPPLLPDSLLSPLFHLPSSASYHNLLLLPALAHPRPPILSCDPLLPISPLPSSHPRLFLTSLLSLSVHCSQHHSKPLPCLLLPISPPTYSSPPPPPPVLTPLPSAVRSDKKHSRKGCLRTGAPGQAGLHRQGVCSQGKL